MNKVEVMTEETKLKPCPFCGGEARVENIGCDTYYVSCSKCDSIVGEGGSREKGIAKWNRREPEPRASDELFGRAIKASYEEGIEKGRESVKSEPGTSVIRWTRYDGIAETLPEVGVIIFIIPNGMSILPITAIYNGAEWEINMTTPHDKKPCYMTKRPTAGDLWASLPEPPEGME